MTTTTADSQLPRPVVAAADPSLLRRARYAAQDTATVLWRDTIRTQRQPDLLVFAVVMGVFFLVLFNYVFGGSIGAGAGIDYLDFLVPGVLIITALQGAQQTSLGLATDLTDGVIDRLRTLPMSRVAVIAGRTVADAARNIVSLVLVAVVAMLMGYRFASALGALGAIALASAVGYGFSWLGAAIATKVRRPDLVGMLSMFWLFPLMLASTAFAPAGTMPGWLQPFVTYQPISTASDAVRGLANGTPAAGAVLLSLGWTVLLVAACGATSIRLYQKDPQ